LRYTDEKMDVNAEFQHTAAMLDSPTLYPSPYVVMGLHGYTKHYYVGAERICAKIGEGFDPNFSESRPDLQETAFFYHPDLCGSRAQSQTRLSYAEMKQSVRSKHLASERADEVRSGIAHITTTSVQHLQYLPFGERYIDQHPFGYQERFTFTGNAPRKGKRIPLNEIKYNEQRDEETGFGYFGARYLDNELLTSFISVDRYASKYPFISPYAYCAWNPVKITDPNGDSLQLEGTEEQRQKVLNYLHQCFENLTFECDDNGYVTLNKEFSTISTRSDQYIAGMISDDKNISVIKIMETDYVASRGVRMRKNNPTLFGGTTDCPKDGNWKTGRVEGKQFLNINKLGSICGHDDESKKYPGRIIMHEFSEGFEGCFLARKFERPLRDKDYFLAHTKANEHFFADFISGANNKIKLGSEHLR